MYDVIIIGGGAAGLFLAAQGTGTDTLLLEKMEQPGNKLRISGSGMCNITNTDDPQQFLSHFPQKEQQRFLTPALRNFSTAAMRGWLESLGLPLIVRDDHKVFPASLDARDVIRVLTEQAQRQSVQIRCSQPVQEVSSHPDGGFLIRSPDERYRCRYLVLATGGRSYPVTGSTGDGYRFASGMGLTITEPTQALCAVIVEDFTLQQFAGNTVRGCFAEFFHRGSDSRYQAAIGDMLITHKGISGPLILNNSRSILPGDRICISFIQADSREDARKKLLSHLAAQPLKQLLSVLKLLGIGSSLASFLLSSIGIDAQTRCTDVPKRKKKELIRQITAYEFSIGRKERFSTAMVTAGGVSLEEVSRTTMEAKRIPGLFIIGELLDIDGDTGGYNLQAAASTAKLVSDRLRCISSSG